MNIFKSFGSRLRIRGHGRWHVAASLFLVAIVLFGTAQPHPAHASEGAEPSFIEIPFAPPTDTPLRYRLVSERNADGDTMTRIFEQELQFRVAASGYELTVTTLSMSDGNITVTAEAALTNPAMQEALALTGPVTLALDEYGSPLYVVDWEMHRQKLTRLPGILAAATPAEDRLRAQAVTERALAPFLAATEVEAVDLLLKHWPAFLGWGGTAQPEGEIVEYSGEVESPLVPVLLPQQGQLSLEKTDAGGVKLTLREETDSEAIQQAMLAYFESLGSEDDPQHQAMMARLKPDFADAQDSNTMEMVFAPESGKILSAKIERRFDFAAGSGSEVTMVELIE